MDRRLRDWIIVSCLVGVALVAAGTVLAAGPSKSGQDGGGIQWARTMGLALAGFAVLVGLFHRRVAALLLRDGPIRTSAPMATLFIASFVALFLELVIIRYAGSQIRIFAFYKNVPLISAFLGLGLGCALGAARTWMVPLLLLWLLPLSVFLSAGSFVFSDAISQVAALASSEQMLGDAAVQDLGTLAQVGGQVGMGALCLVTLIALASFFIPIGRLLGVAFDQVPRLTAYTINILGSLAGTGMFILLGCLWTPPWAWMIVGLVPLLWWIAGRRQAIAASCLVALAVLAVVPTVGTTVWSPYQKLVGRQVDFRVGTAEEAFPGYVVDISDVFYQVAIDLRPEAVARYGMNPFPHYDGAFSSLASPPRHVLVVGAGTGNDVAAALRAGAVRVDAVDIDPAIVAFGRTHHPERPYDDPRVRIVIDDARAAFRRLEPGQYDAVVFGLLDSHTQLGVSSVRLDNYVFTSESFHAAGRLLRPGGSLVVTAATFRDWFRQRLIGLLGNACNAPVQTRAHDVWFTYTCQVQPAPAAPARAATLPADDWPFLYLPQRGIPRAYAIVVALLVLGSLLVVRSTGLSPRRFTAYHGHLFFLGAAFLLMEVYAINRLALLFGTTWIVAAVTITLVLTLIVAANLTVILTGGLAYPIAYAGLLASLLGSFLLNPGSVLGAGLGASVAYGLAVLLPVFFAGLIFARSFASAAEAGPAIGANMLGAVLGGWLEYASMALGIRALALLALGLYAASALCLLASAARVRSPAHAS